MFARTKRLTLRPGWPEDAPALAEAIAHEPVVTKLTHAPWPYTMGDAASFLALPRDADTPRFLVFDHLDPTPRLIGSVELRRGEDAAAWQLGYWLTPAAWGRGYATEAGRAVIEMARHALPVRRLASSYFIDNPASGRVLRKLGFRETGRTITLPCRARGSSVDAVELERDLDDDRPQPAAHQAPDPAMPMAIAA